MYLNKKNKKQLIEILSECVNNNTDGCVWGDDAFVGDFTEIFNKHEKWMKTQKKP